MKLTRLFTIVLLLIVFMNAKAGENPGPAWWRVRLARPDGHHLVFNFEWMIEGGKPVWYIRNATERIRVDDITVAGDSLFVQMPVFESRFRLKLHHDNRLTGTWIKGTAGENQVYPFAGEKGKERRFDLRAKEKPGNAAGRWKVQFTRANNTTRPAVAEFQQHGNYLSGTFLTPSGDYRYLEGTVAGDSLLLSCFDGSHAYFFCARISGDSITNGWYYAGWATTEKWTAVKDSRAKLPANAAAMHLRDGETKLDFTFNDLDGKRVSIKDDRYKNKVVIIQIMGSWCPNCMDETAFLSDYYRNNRSRGVEIVALAYEYSTDPERSRRSLRKFQQRYQVEYPMLVTGVSTSDSLRTEKTLPQLSAIKAFPTDIFLDKKGVVRKIDTGFYGPGTGNHYLQFKKEFEATVDALLRE